MAWLVTSFYLDFTTTYAADIIYIIYMLKLTKAQRD